MDGVLVVDKPAGPTSHDVVAAARRVLHERRIGHTGTLDPFATGVLALCVGRATRLARFLAPGIKAYRAEVHLGFATTTDDLTGAPLGPEMDAAQVGDAAIAAACADLTGDISQRPPAYSAKHVDGERAYDLARRGEAPDLPPVEVHVASIDVVERNVGRLVLDVRCSPGTYVRALARDLGERLGVGGHLVALRRTATGSLTLDVAVPYPSFSGWAERLQPLDALLPELPSLRLGDDAARGVRQGRAVDPRALGLPMPVGERVRLLDAAGRLLALAVPRGAHLHPDLVLAE